MPQSDAADAPISFARGLFAGVVHDHLLFPYPKPLDERDPDQAREVRRLIRELRRLQGDVIDPERIDEEERVPEEVITAFAEIGMLGLTIPRQYGGLGLSSTAYARVFSALSAVDASLAVLVGVHCGLGSRAIAMFGTAEQQAAHLPGILRADDNEIDPVIVGGLHNALGIHGLHRYALGDGRHARVAGRAEQLGRLR